MLKRHLGQSTLLPIDVPVGSAPVSGYLDDCRVGLLAERRWQILLRR
jgi:hypothetical protein